MKLDLSILEQLDIDPHESREPIYAMRVSEMLVMLKEDADRIIAKSDRFFRTDDDDVQADCIDIVSARLNDYVQVFMDLVIYLRIKEGTYNGRSDSLRYCVSGYDSFFKEQSPEEKQFLGNLILRNEITHDYFNREIHQQKLISMMQNDMEGAWDIYNHLYDYCNENGFLMEFVNKS